MTSGVVFLTLPAIGTGQDGCAVSSGAGLHPSRMFPEFLGSEPGPWQP